MKINKTLKNILSAGVLAIFIILGGGSLDTDGDAEKISVATPDYVLSANKLFKEYDKNSVAADAKYEDKIVKVIVQKKTDLGKFENFIDKLYKSGVAELKIVENFDFNNLYDSETEGYESEDTLSILNRYIEESEVSLDKSRIQKMIQETYQEACEMV